MWQQAVLILRNLIPELNNISIDFDNEQSNKRGPYFNHDEVTICLPSKQLKDVVPLDYIIYLQDKLGEKYSELMSCIFCVLHEYNHYRQFRNFRQNYNRCCVLISKLREIAKTNIITDFEFNNMYRTIDIEFRANKFASWFINKNYDNLKL